MNKEELINIAYDKGFEVVETTSDQGGYPRGLGWAIAGFETFEEAQALADEYGLEVVLLEKRDGWWLWYNSGKLWEAPTLTPEDLGYIEMYGNTDKERVIEDFKEKVTGFDDMESILHFAKSRCEIIEEIDCLGDNEIIFAERYDGDLCEWKTVNIHPTGWSYDTHIYLVAVSEERKY